ncbi:hypothetical protein HMPREF1212_04943 [Parabacteroides sp. HGS0025]|uniref:DUF6383 domain-containing protein n=1 Tax=Parabacteroides sp. HGS0025 TaxID=1078087 RepID=UPI00061732D9|nr:DUF6383 domain-containing protein [Parabacteroides sp. HGS0025]KKB45787.1 hypothetical protein HMPREF1212_04943 [Parabacteroides sp. HGS0025]
MNKKFSTLVAALLASGGLFYAVDAMILPAGDGVAQTIMTTVTRAANGTVTGYLLGVADATDNYATNWVVKGAANNQYLVVKDAPSGEVWYLATDYTVKKATGSNAPADALMLTFDTKKLKITDAAADTWLGLDGAGKFATTGANDTPDFNYVGLFGGDRTVKSGSANADDEVALCVIGEGHAALDPAVQKAATVTFTKADVTASTAADITDWDAAIPFVLEQLTEDEVDYYALSYTINGTTYYLGAASNVTGAAVNLVTEPTLELCKVETSATGVTLAGIAIDNPGTNVIVLNSGSITGGQKVALFAKASPLAAVQDLNSLKVGAVCYLGAVPDANLASTIVYSDTDVSPIEFDPETIVKKACGSFASMDISEANNNTNVVMTIGDNNTVMFEGKSTKAYLTNAAAWDADVKNAAAFIIGTDGALKLQNGGDFLYSANSSNALSVGNETAVAGNPGNKKLTAYEIVNGTVNTFAATSLEAGKQYVFAEITDAASVPGDRVTTTPQTAEEAGANVAGMTEAGVRVENGKITFIPGNTEATAIPAPFTVKSTDGKYLQTTGWTAANEVTTPDSWILMESKLVNLAAQKAGENAMYLGVPSKADAYALVVKDKALTVTYNATQGLVIAGTATTATLSTTAEAPALVMTGQLTSVSSGDIVTISDGTNSVNNEWKIVISALSNDNYSYSFLECNGNGQEVSPKAYLKVGGETDFIGKMYDGSFSLQTKNGSFLKVENGVLVSNNVQTPLTLFKFDVQAEAKPFTVDKLLNDFGSRVSFGVALGHKYIDEDGDAATKAITTGNVFADADLVPVKYDKYAADGKKLVELTDDNNSNESTFLLKSGGRYIVLETTKDSEWTSIKTDLKNGGYKFTTVSEKAMLEILTDGTFNKGDYAPYFTFSYDNVKNEGGKGKAVYSIEVKDYNQASLATKLFISSFEVKTGAQKGVYLTVTTDPAYWVAAELGLNNLVKAKSDNSPLNYTYVNIEFANHPSVMSRDRDSKVLNGRVPSASVYNTADKSEMLFNKPEGQWIVNVGGQSGELNKKGVAGLKDATNFTFVNRESGKKFTVNAMYYLGDNKYAVSPSIFANYPATRDTMIITGVKDLKAGTLQRDGYADLKASDVQDEQFRLLVASTEEDYYVGENHTAKSHFLGLSHNEEAAVNWRIVPLTGAREFDKDGFLKTASDSIYELRYPQYFKDDKLFSKNDTIAIIGYALQNTANDEYLTYENPQTTTTLSMICDPNFKSFKTTKDVSNAYRFVLKEKATDLYNIVSVNGGATYDKDGYPEGSNANPFTLGSSKLYGATTLTKQGAVEVDGMYSKINSNDLFKVQKVGAPEYRLQSMGDTIRIFRQENDYDQMYENGEFLNLGNKAQLTTMAPALYVDTAYVKRGHNNRYQYLLVVNPKYVPAEPCTIPGHPTVHPDTTYGRFLVNLIDTAYVAYTKGAIHTNKYINDAEAGEPYAKLGFVYGFRTADKLYITDKNYKKSAKASDVIDLGTSDFNTAKFAFRYINPINHESDGSFKIQTGYYDYDSYIAGKKQPEVANNGYLKNINGVVVVAKGYEAGDKFDLAAEHSIPTANEGINTSEVSVIAKEGEVVINGAAGKTVVITNVLGQTIANTVLSSDNATISAPAGIVVVAVEGEAAVKAIVK